LLLETGYYWKWRCFRIFSIRSRSFRFWYLLL